MKKMFLRLTPFALLICAAAVSLALGSLANLQMPSLLADAVNIGVQNGDMDFVLQIGAAMLGVTVLRVICGVVTGYCSSRISTGFGANLRADIFEKVQSYSSGEIDEFGTASLITRTTNDVMQIQHFMMMFIRVMMSAPITMIGGVYMAFMRNSTLATLVLIAMPIIAIIVVGIAKISLPVTRTMQAKLDKVNLVMREKLTGVRVIRAFGTDDYERDRFKDANKDLTQTTIKLNRIMNLMGPLTMMVLNCTTVAIIWFGAKNVDLGTMQVGDIMAIVEYVMQILMTITMLSMIFVRFPRAVTSSGRINAVLEKDTKIKDGSFEKEPQGRGDIEFKNVNFSYPNASEPALSNISFKAQKGQTVAIIGSTGSGKTTLISLIPRFYDTSSGEILIDGVNVRDYKVADLRQKMGFATQKAVLFSGTVQDNILYGKPDATPDEIAKAVQVAQANDFVNDREEGLRAEITQGGTNVSGGQKQRLSVARAVVRKPEFYIFDDTFSALDFQTDYNLRKALSERTQDSTVIIVAQRVSTIMSADLILVLENGALVGKGTHRELLESCEVYREIVYSQISEEEAKADGR